MKTVGFIRPLTLGSGLKAIRLLPVNVLQLPPEAAADLLHKHVAACDLTPSKLCALYGWPTVPQRLAR